VEAAITTLTARIFAALTCLVALGCVLPLTLAGGPGVRELLLRAVVLAVLHAGCEHSGRVRLRLRARSAGRRNESAAGEGPARQPGAPYLPVLLAGAMLLPPYAAALVPLPGALLARAEPPRALRRAWNSAQLAVAAWTAAQAFGLLGGPRMLAAVLSGGAHALPLPALLLPAGAAALAFVLVNAGLVTAMRALAEPGALPHGGLRLAGVLPGALAHGLLGLLVAVLWVGPYHVFAAALVLLPLSVSAWVYAQYHRERAAHRATVRALVQAVEIKDEYTRGHSERVGRASVLIARQLGMAQERVAALRVAGTLHDVGKLGVPTRVLRKSGPLTAEERAAVELHPEYGHEMVRGIGFLGEARGGILHHHERYDGRGYPYGLAGAAIPEFARVIAVADAFDSMTSTRSYRRGRPVPEAVTELERCAGTQFDPVMVRALVAALRTYGWQPAPPPADEADVPDLPLGLAEAPRPVPRPEPAAEAPALLRAGPPRSPAVPDRARR
jgi:hypothetical protein